MVRRREEARQTSPVMTVHACTQHQWYKAAIARQYNTANNTLFYALRIHSQGMESRAQQRDYVFMAEHTVGDELTSPQVSTELRLAQAELRRPSGYKKEMVAPPTLSLLANPS